MLLSGLYVYPLKSGAALAPRQAGVEARGLEHDRRWMLVDAQGRFLTGRELPAIVRIRAEPGARGLHLRIPGQPDQFTEWPQPQATRARVTVWNSTVDAVVGAAAVNAALGQYLQRDVRLVHMDARSWRPTSPRRSQPGDQVSFADGYPFLLISQASLDGLNARLAQPVPMLRFRPNLVVDGVPEHAEDHWKRIRIGRIEFDVVKPCTRCGFTVVEPETGRLDPSGEPLRTLARYRRSDEGVSFGQNLIARGRGLLRLGDRVELIA